MIACAPVRPACAVLLSACALLPSGCLEQTVRIDPALAPKPAPAKPVPQVVVINTRPYDAHKVFTLSKNLPVEVSVDAVRRADAGLERCELDVRNPLVWWQRFPCDIATALLPIRFLSLTTATIAYQPVPTCDEAALTSEATRHGFAHDPAR